MDYKADDPMRNRIGRIRFHPARSLGSTLLWGILEFIALQRSRLARRR